MIYTHSFTFNTFQENTYIVYDDTHEAVIIDPGCYESYEKTALKNFIAEKKLCVKYLLNTHGHIDHVLGNAFVKAEYDAPFVIHALDESTLRAVNAYASNYGFPHYQEQLPDTFCKEGDTLTWGDSSFDVLFLPGHAPGHIGFYNAHQKIMISGDVLFKASVGRTDLPGGDTEQLMETIHQKIFVLPNDTIVYPGHGEKTSIGEEKKNNPFCALPHSS